ncbi:NAD-dependent epimerase/dehydratase family protein [Trichlorobacter ammonificans]|uniref:UDP-glucose 4-epimerase n=1 Tax=Trichlorobacter ammonificans TaxID=2916410 RepID=A0ABM9D6A4_9BACT|nr:NAD-dependent epimerase/dehydratase family protein [Trichlorobacter ammonificans]CAH2030481.1 UDP-glucose 4-epimerase [Trichlorobacter ammonificans]
MSFADAQILITGGAGFIGSNLAIRLAGLGARVTVMDSMLPGYGGNLFNLEPVRGQIAVNFSDMRDSHSLGYLIRGKDYIFNLAGQVSHQDSMHEPLMDMEINVKAQLVLLEACRHHNPGAVIVYASTRQFYGTPEYLPVDERHPINPPDVNGINKLAGEQYHTLYSRVHGMRTVSLRLTNTYGPRQLIRNARQGFIGWFMNRAVTGSPLQLFGGGDQVRDFNHVDDVVEAFLLAARTPCCYGDYFNLSGEKAALYEVAEQLIAASGRGSVEKIPFPDERKKIDIGSFWGNSDKFRAATGWSPQISLERGLADTVAYYQENCHHYLEDA